MLPRTIVAVLVITAVLAATTGASLDAKQTKVLARSTTTRSFDSVLVRVYLRNDPAYARELRYLRARLGEARTDLDDARRSIVRVGEVTPAQRRAQEEFLAPFVERVVAAKAELADLARDYVRPFRTYGFRVSAARGQTVELDWTLECRRGQVTNELSGTLARRTPVELWRGPTIRRAHSCLVSASVSRAGSGHVVTILVGRR